MSKTPLNSSATMAKVTARLRSKKITRITKPRAHAGTQSLATWRESVAAAPDLPSAKLTNSQPAWNGTAARTKLPRVMPSSWLRSPITAKMTKHSRSPTSNRPSRPRKRFFTSIMAYSGYAAQVVRSKSRLGLRRND